MLSRANGKDVLACLFASPSDDRRSQNLEYEWLDGSKTRDRSSVPVDNPHGELIYEEKLLI